MVAMVMLSRPKLPAGGPDIGKFCSPAVSFGSGNCPAAMAAALTASTPLALADRLSAVLSARSSAAWKLKGSACATLARTRINKVRVFM